MWFELDSEADIILKTATMHFFNCIVRVEFCTMKYVNLGFSKKGYTLIISQLFLFLATFILPFAEVWNSYALKLI